MFSPFFVAFAINGCWYFIVVVSCDNWCASFVHELTTPVKISGCLKMSTNGNLWMQYEININVVKSVQIYDKSCTICLKVIEIKSDEKVFRVR